MEIERKYAVQCLPGDLSLFQNKQIEQGYLCHKPIIRIRKYGSAYILTYKAKVNPDRKDSKGAIINHEVELPLTEEAFLELKAKVDGDFIYKTRYYIPLEHGLTAELDVFDGKLKGFTMVEVEFPDESSANEFVPPAWFGKELSSDKRFSNYYLSRISSLEELEG